MKWDKLKPCDNCPFLRGTPMSLSPNRAEEIGSMMLSSGGGTFPCHKTTVSDDDDDGGRHATDKSKHCAGALIFAEVQGNATQMMRIAERLGFYDHAKLMADKEVVASVFDSMEEFCEHMTRYEK